DRLKKPSKLSLAHLKEEVTAQVKTLLDAGFSISHADSHNHIHTAVFFEKTIKDVLFAFGIKKIRLHRNFGDIKLVKRMVKFFYNAKLHRQGFITTEKMGKMSDLEKYPETAKKYFCEIMVHPFYDKNGTLVDIVDWDEQGVSAVRPLTDIRALTNGCELVSYLDL
ncbi:MAG: ChbG/HpnK family deacetylase, partial [Clostridia bacterium]|nr:ChbG/HpnK family deacetylase [Clostridia bacterium]